MDPDYRIGKVHSVLCCRRRTDRPGLYCYFLSDSGRSIVIRPAVPHSTSAMLVLLSALLLGLTTSLLLYRAWRPGKVQLRGKTIFISGCDTGFGFSLAVHCAELGMKVVAGCFTAGEGRRQLAEMERITVVELDVTEPASVEEAVRSVERVAGQEGLHCLVNNAACLVFGEAVWQTEVQARRQMEVNYLGALSLTRACLPLLVRGEGRLVNMISNCTECPLPTLGPYTASKVSTCTCTISQLSTFLLLRRRSWRSPRC